MDGIPHYPHTGMPTDSEGIIELSCDYTSSITLTPSLILYFHISLNIWILCVIIRNRHEANNTVHNRNFKPEMSLRAILSSVNLLPQKQH